MNKPKVVYTPKELFTPKVTYANIADIHEPAGLNGGDISEPVIKKNSKKTHKTRWDNLENPKVKKVWEDLISSITKHGFLVGTIAVKLPEDATLFNIDYKKGDWIAIDVNGRLRVLRHLLEVGYSLNPNMDIENQVPIVDVTHLVITDNTFIYEDIIEKLWQTIVILNTGGMKWSEYDFISSGSRAITDPDQKVIWKYLTEIMKKYHTDLTNKVVLSATIRELTDEMKNKYSIPFNMNYKRYSNTILDSLESIRKIQGKNATRAPFLRVLGNYFRQASRLNFFLGCEYKHDGSRDIHSEKECFKLSGNLYEDEHYFEFKKYLEYITESISQTLPPKGGFAGTTAAARREIHEYMLKIHTKWMKS